MQRFVVWLVLSILLLGPTQAPNNLEAGLSWNPVYAQRSGGGVGGRGGFSNSTPSMPRVNPSPAPSIPIPTPRSYPSYPTYPRDYYPSSPSVYVGPGYGYSSDGFDIFTLIVIVVIVLIAISIIGGLRRAGSGSKEVESTVARLRIATLYSRELQQTLKQLANNADTQTTKGLADLVDDAVVLMLREQAGWRFGGWDLWGGSLAQAEGQFDQWMTETRSEFVETYRKYEGKVTENTAYKPQAEPDGRYILVTFVVAAHGVLPQVPKPFRGAAARTALMALSSTTPVTTLAAYLSWTPEASGEALTEQDLLKGWPGLELL